MPSVTGFCESVLGKALDSLLGSAVTMSANMLLSRRDDYCISGYFHVKLIFAIFANTCQTRNLSPAK